MKGSLNTKTFGTDEDKPEGARALIAEGVTWSPKNGAVCPNCGRKKTSTNTTRPWDGAYRIRYHRCAQCGSRFKSIETDHTLQD